MRVLVADDEGGVADSTAELLRASGHEVEVVGRVQDILPALLRQRTQVLLQDVRMPGMDLDAHLHQVRQESALKGLRIILFTATVGIDSLEHHPLTDALLGKPFDPARLIAVVEDRARDA